MMQIIKLQGLLQNHTAHNTSHRLTVDKYYIVICLPALPLVAGQSS